MDRQESEPHHSTSPSRRTSRKPSHHYALPYYTSALSNPPSETHRDIAMEHPSKRHKRSPSPQMHPAEEPSDFISFNTPAGDDAPAATRYGYTTTTHNAATDLPHNAPRYPRAHHNDPSQPPDRPKSLSHLPSHEPWVLLHTHQKRKFVHNTSTRESFWRVPEHLVQAVATAEEAKEVEREKRRNARWAERQLKASRPTAIGAGAGAGANAGNAGGSTRGAGDAAGWNGNDKAGRRRRSESLQREDEEALRAALAAEAEMAEERDVVDTVAAVAPLVPASVGAVAGGSKDTNGERDAGAGYGSDSSYEEVEVTDSEFEDEDDEGRERRAGAVQTEASTVQAEDEPLEFGEDDIAFQLAALHNSNSDPDSASEDSQNEDDYDFDDDSEEEFIEGGNPFDKNIHLRRGGVEFCAMLMDHHISPYTPWEKLLADTGPESIVLDDRFTMLPSTRVRKAFWEHWVKDTIAFQKVERERKAKAGEVEDPRVSFLEFLRKEASTKLYWTEFRRKFKKSPEMNTKGLTDKEREKLYRDFISKLKLPERKQKEDFQALLQSLSEQILENWNAGKGLKILVKGDVRYAALAHVAREQVIEEFISQSVAAGSKVGKSGGKDGRDDVKREKAIAEREEKVEEERRRVEKEERWAKRELMLGQRELRRAMV